MVISPDFVFKGSKVKHQALSHEVGQWLSIGDGSGEAEKTILGMVTKEIDLIC